LPTYNSNVIDSYLHLIPGLTNLFIYFNDDVFARSHIHPSDLFTSSHGLKLSVENLTIPVNKTQQQLFIEKVKDKPYWRAFFGTFQLLERTYGREKLKPLRILQHTPHIFHKGAIERMHSMWGDEFSLAHRNKFRAETDIIFVVSHILQDLLR
jgi:hypothetical protein